MPRKPCNTKRLVLADPLYKKTFVQKLVNQISKNGKKFLAYKIVYTALKNIKQKTRKNPAKIFSKALANIAPSVEMRPRRRSGSVQLVPFVLQGKSSSRSEAIALDWLLEICRKKNGQSMVSKLQYEILEAYKKKGLAIRKKEELCKIATKNAMYASNPQRVLNAIEKMTRSENTVTNTTRQSFPRRNRNRQTLPRRNKNSLGN